MKILLERLLRGARFSYVLHILLHMDPVNERLEP